MPSIRPVRRTSPAVKVALVCFTAIGVYALSAPASETDLASDRRPEPAVVAQAPLVKAVATADDDRWMADESAHGLRPDAAH